MKQIELTSKLVLAIVGLAAVSAILIPTYAVPSIKSADIVDGEVKTADLANDAVTSEKIKNGEVKTEDLASGAVKPNVHIVSKSGTIGAGEHLNIRVDCPAGESATGGGYSGPDGIEYALNEPTTEFGASSWLIGAVNHNNIDESIVGRAVCIGPFP
jgi:hypothetical protein